MEVGVRCYIVVNGQHKMGTEEKCIKQHRKAKKNIAVKVAAHTLKQPWKNQYIRALYNT